LVWAAAAVRGMIPARRQALMVVVRVFIGILLWLRMRMLGNAEHGKYKTRSHLLILAEGFDTVCFSLTTQNFSGNGLGLATAQVLGTNLLHIRVEM
jgi:hypothetical protein